MGWAEFMLPSNPPDDTGLNFIFFDWAADGSKQEFGPELEYRSESGLEQSLHGSNLAAESISKLLDLQAMELITKCL